MSDEPQDRRLTHAGSDVHSARDHVTFGNHLLDGLPLDERVALGPYLHTKVLGVQNVLADPGRRMEEAYFPLDCIASLMTVMRDGRGVEVGLIGGDGMLPVSTVFDGGAPMQRAVVMIAGTALAIKSDDLRLLAKTHAAIGRRLLRYAHAALNQAAQLAACNGLHLLEQRCARWLLMAHDRVRRNEIRVTQEMLAMTLGVHRPGVTVAAQALQAKGSIAYRHGTVLVLNRKRLESAACECYASIAADYARLFGAQA